MAKAISTPIPDFLAHRPVDRRGYPTLFMLGEEQFKGLVPQRLYACLIGKLCGICGEPLDYWKVFVGGPKSCENRVFSDPPFHRRCVDFAFEVCPYLIGAWDRTNLPHGEQAVIDDPAGTPERPERMGIYTTRQYKAKGLKSGVVLFLPAPAKQIEWREFRHGHAAEGQDDGSATAMD